MAKYIVLSKAAVQSCVYDDLDTAEVAAGRKADENGVAHVIVKAVAEVRRRSEPNVELIRLDEDTEVRDGQPA